METDGLARIFSRLGRGMLLAWAGTALAAERVMSEAEFLAEMPVVLSVSRLNQPVQDAPAAVTVIDRETIIASGFRNVVDLLRLVPGFHVGYFSGNEPVATRGLAGRFFGRIQVLVDGRSVYMPMFGQVYWTLLPLDVEDVERIEVVRGPNAASFGANSFLGVVNIITRRPEQDPGWFLGVRLGDPAARSGLLRYAGGEGPWRYRLSLGHREDTGFPVRVDDARVDHVSLVGDYRLNHSDVVELMAGYAGGQLGQGWVGKANDPPRHQAAASGYLHLRWHRAAAADDEWMVQLYHTFHRSREEAAIFALGLVRLKQDSDRQELELQRTQGVGPHLRLVWGGSLRHDSVHAPLYLGTDARHSAVMRRLFAHGEWEPSPAWTVNAGAMIENHSLTGTDISPRFSVTRHWGGRHSLRVGISTATRSPTLLEAAANYRLGPAQIYRGATEDKPERLMARELAYLGQFPEWGLSGGVRLFEERLGDILYADKNLPVSLFIFKSGNSLKRQGIESELNFSRGATRLTLAHSYLRVSRVQGVSADAATDLAEADPRHTFALLLDHRFSGGLRASLGFYHYGNMWPLGGGGDLQPAYNRLDLRLARTFRMAHGEAEVAAGVQNALGSHADFLWDPSNPSLRNEFRTRGYLALRAQF